MPETPNAAELAREIADLFEAEGLAYAIGGALALGYYTSPRATHDVDVNVFVPPAEKLAPLLESLGRIGFVPDDGPERLRQTATEEGQFRGRVRGMRVDVFVPALDYYASLEARRRQVTLLGKPTWILGPEDLVILKMIFFRRKDLADVEAVLIDQEGSIDRGFIRSTLVDLVGVADDRLRTLDEIEHDVSRTP